MNATLSSTAKTRRKKSLAISFGLHTGLLALGLVPLASELDITRYEEEMMIVPVVFAEAQESSSSASETAQVTETPVETTIEEVNEVAETVTVEESEVVETEPVEIAENEAIEDQTLEADVESASQASTDESGEEGLGTGDANGVGEGAAADGVITRKVIHRADIAEAAEYSGTIVVDICIDRRGRILTAQYNPEKTTVDDMEMVRKALDIAALYRFETDYEAALRECGSLTFIFDIDAGIGEVSLMADAGVK